MRVAETQNAVTSALKDKQLPFSSSCALHEAAYQNGNSE